MFLAIWRVRWTRSLGFHHGIDCENLLTGKMLGLTQKVPVEMQIEFSGLTSIAPRSRTQALPGRNMVSWYHIPIRIGTEENTEHFVHKTKPESVSFNDACT